MEYNFDIYKPRIGVGSEKWDAMHRSMSDLPKDIVPLSTADMEFATPPEIVEGLKRYLDDTILGYTVIVPSYYDALRSWMDRRLGWQIQDEWVVITPGVVSAFTAAIKAFSAPGDGVIIMPPVYFPFYAAIEKNSCKVVRSPLLEGNARYEIDFDDLEKKAKDPNNKILLFCSPHNPGGRVWPKEDLLRIAQICLENDLLLISDEIHADFIMPGHRHTVMATLSEAIADITITCTAPSKTFNLAGLNHSNIIISNAALREQFKAQYDAIYAGTSSVLSWKACEIAYTSCEGWLDELNQYIHDNYNFTKKYIQEYAPHIGVFDLEGTYLMWLDCRKMSLSKERLKEEMHNAHLFFNEGYIFGEEGAGFERLNLACPRSVLEKAMERFCEVARRHRP